MARYDYNVAVIGAGSAGLVSSYIGAAIKARIALIERNKMGGDCLNYGCVPSKAIIRTSRLVADMKRHKELGIKRAEYEIDFAQVMERVQSKIQMIEPHDSVERYTNLGVECFQGDAVITDPHRIKVGNSAITARSIILALGASPFVPPIKNIDKIDYLTSENLWNLRELPRRLVVLGGGPIGSEMALAFQRLGSQVIQIEMSPRILPREDNDVADFMTEQFLKEGVHILCNTKAQEISAGENCYILKCETNGEPVYVEFDRILLAVGRRPNTGNYDWSKLGVDLNPNGTFKVDKYLRTTRKNIYACGDAVGPYQFTHTAAHQAWFCAVNSLLSPYKKFKVNYNAVSWCTFTDPEIAQVGLNEKAARNACIPYEVTKYGIDDLDRAICESEDHGFVKVLTKPGSDQILGVTIVSHLAGEMIGEFVAAIKHGFGLNKILGTMHAYPTFIEANKYAAGVWKKAHSPNWALRILERFHSWRRC